MATTTEIKGHKLIITMDLNPGAPIIESMAKSLKVVRVGEYFNKKIEVPGVGTVTVVADCYRKATPKDLFAFMQAGGKIAE